MLTRRLTISFAAALLLSAGLSARAQSGAVRAKPTPTPAAAESEDEERVLTEEVRLNVAATDEKGRFDPALELDDVLVVEDDVPQQVKSVRRIPASVMIVAAAGGELNPVMRAATTRAVALALVEHLRDGDSVAAVQYGGRAELLQPWTTDKARAARSLRTKLLGGSGSNLSQALARAAELFEGQPVGNRHLVLITDGVDAAGRADAAAASRRLLASQASVHVISYTEVSRREMKEREKNPKEAPGAAQARADIATVGIDPTRPPGMRGPGINPPQVNGGIRFDPALSRRRKAYEREMKKAEGTLRSLADETGGQLYLPASTDEMTERAGEVAREVGTQYVVTYRPKRPLAGAPAGEYRRVRVGARRIGLSLRARRGYVVGTMRQKDEAR